MTSDDSDRDVLAQLVFEARPSAPPGLDVRVLALARARSRRRIAAVAAAGAVLASAVVLVLLPAPPEREASPVVVPETAGPDTPTPADAATQSPGWADALALLEQLSTPHRAELRACFAAPGDHRFAFTVRQRSAEDAARNPRDPVVYVVGHRVWNAQDACLDRIVAAMPFPKLPDELRSVSVDLAVSAGSQPLVVASPGDAWTDPVAAVRTLMRSEFQNRRIRVPFTAESCFENPHSVAYVDIELARGARPRYLREHPLSPGTRFDACLEYAIARIATLDLPPSLRYLVVRFRPTPPSPDPPWVDLPPWPSGDQLELTWLISSPPGAPDTAFAVELLATIGDVTRRVGLAVQFGRFVPSNQTFCAGRRRDGAPAPQLGKDELALIAFGQPADAGYLVRRGAAGDFLAIDAWNQPRGGCVRGNREYNPCPRSQRVVALIHTPPGIKVQQRIATVADSGEQLEFRCSR